MQIAEHKWMIYRQIELSYDILFLATVCFALQCAIAFCQIE